MGKGKRPVDVNGDEQERKRAAYTPELKVKLIEMARSGRYTNHAAALAAFNKEHKLEIKASTMSDWLKKEQELRKQAADPALKNKTHAKGSDFLYVEESMRWWFFQGAVLADSLLQKQAMQYAKIVAEEFERCGYNDQAERYRKFTASTGWVTKFKKRVGARSLHAKGEAASADMEGVALAREVLPRLLQKWEPRNVWNMDETGLCYKALPSTTLTPDASKSGLKLRKDRITLGLICSMYGERRPPIIINKSLQPRSFKGFKVQDYCSWHANTKAWMTTEVFSKEMKKFAAWAKSKNRKIALVCDNAPTHQVDGAEEVEMEGLDCLLVGTHLTIIFLPPNVTAIAQPLDQGIIAALKARYKHIMLVWYLQHYNLSLVPGNDVDLSEVMPSVKEAVMWVHEVWRDMPAVIFANCWRKAEILPPGWAAAKFPKTAAGKAAATAAADAALAAATTGAVVAASTAGSSAPAAGAAPGTTAAAAAAAAAGSAAGSSATAGDDDDDDDDAVVELQTVMSQLAQVVGGSAVTLEDVQQFVEDPDESEVDKPLTHREIVTLVVPEVQKAAQKRLEQDAAAAAEEDNPVNIVSLSQAQMYAEAVMHYVSVHPEHFSASEVSAASALSNHLSRVVITNQRAKQVGIRQFLVPAAPAPAPAAAAAAADPSAAAAAADEEVPAAGQGLGSAD